MEKLLDIEVIKVASLRGFTQRVEREKVQLSIEDFKDTAKTKEALEEWGNEVQVDEEIGIYDADEVKYLLVHHDTGAVRGASMPTEVYRMLQEVAEQCSCPRCIARREAKAHGDE